MKCLFFFVGMLAGIASVSQAQAQVLPAKLKQWQRQAAAVSIIRDNWGIPHIYGNTDADAVFGLIYAQCEDDSGA